MEFLILLGLLALAKSGGGSSAPSSSGATLPGSNASANLNDMLSDPYVDAMRKKYPGFEGRLPGPVETDLSSISMPAGTPYAVPTLLAAGSDAVPPSPAAPTLLSAPSTPATIDTHIYRSQFNPYPGDNQHPAHGELFSRDGDEFSQGFLPLYEKTASGWRIAAWLMDEQGNLVG